jgi:serine phosphatase RsbU (regulator of sigma subunit)
MQNGTQPTRTPLPTALPPPDGLDMRVRYYSTRTGGDFFDAVATGPYIIFLLTDIAGTRDVAHTIAAATQDVFRRRAPQLFTTEVINMMDTLASLAHEINQAIYESAAGSRLAPTFLGCYNLPLGLLAYINSGGPAPIFRDNDGTRTLGPVTMPLGLFTHLTFEPAIQAFEPGARMLLVTKGIIEAERGSAHFGPDRVTEIMNTFNGGSALDLCQATLQPAHQFRKPNWYQSLKQSLKKVRMEDMTAVALIRPQ